MIPLLLLAFVSVVFGQSPETTPTPTLNISTTTTTTGQFDMSFTMSVSSSSVTRTAIIVMGCVIGFLVILLVVFVAKRKQQTPNVTINYSTHKANSSIV